jgi:hypothetical protein
LLLAVKDVITRVDVTSEIEYIIYHIQRGAQCNHISLIASYCTLFILRQTDQDDCRCTFTVYYDGTCLEYQGIADNVRSSRAYLYLFIEKDHGLLKLV